MKTLKLTFRSGSHSTRTIQLKYVAEELDEATIKQAMQGISELQLLKTKAFSSMSIRSRPNMSILKKKSFLLLKTSLK